MHTYAVKEIYYTLQGEGAHTGRAAVFCRFAGCNLWTGHEKDRRVAVCQFCDTDFVGTHGPGGGRFRAAESLADAVAAEWPANAGGSPYVICTGGEPLLQVDTDLIEALHMKGFEIGVETNGTQPVPSGIDWICVSPKGTARLKVAAGDELKLVFPQREPEAAPSAFEHLSFRHFFLQPMDGPEVTSNTHAAIRYCQQHPRWRLSLQTHKFVGLP